MTGSGLTCSVARTQTALCGTLRNVTNTPHPGPLVRALREASRISQAALAEQVGMPFRTLNNLEAGRRRAHAWVAKLAAALDVHPDVLTGHAPIIRALRERRAITTEELAAVAKVTVEELADLEIGAEVPDPLTAQRLGRRLGIDPACLGPAAQVVAA